MGVFFLGVAAVLLVFVIHPIFKGIEKGYEEIALNKNNTLSVSLQNVQLDEFKGKYEEYKPNLEKVTSAFIDEKNPVDFIKFLEAAASESGVSAEISIAQPPKTQVAGNNIVAFQAVVRGDFLDILRFCETLERGHYLAAVKSFFAKKSALDASEKKSEAGEVEAIFLIEVSAK